MVTIILFVIVLACKLLLDAYLKTRSGYLLRAVGDNDVLVTSLAKDKGMVKIVGLAIDVYKRQLYLKGCIRPGKISHPPGRIICGFPHQRDRTLCFQEPFRNHAGSVWRRGYGFRDHVYLSLIHI